MGYCYIYCHKRKDNGQIFYIGRGRGQRLKFKNSRSKAWNEVVQEAGGFLHEKLWDNLSSEDAKSLELMYIDLLGESLINKIKTYSDPLSNFTSEHLSSYFEYNEQSPSSLLWKKNYRDKKSGDVAGYLSSGYYVLRFSGKRIRVNRLVYFLMKSQNLGDNVVDHLDGNTKNNKISNLRLCTQRQNCRNRVTKTRTTTGHIGIFITYKKEYKYLTATALGCIKNFSLQKLKYADALSLAISWRSQKLSGLDSSDSFTERHLRGLQC